MKIKKRRRQCYLFRFLLQWQCCSPEIVLLSWPWRSAPNVAEFRCHIRLAPDQIAVTPGTKYGALRGHSGWMLSMDHPTWSLLLIQRLKHWSSVRQVWPRILVWQLILEPKGFSWTKSFPLTSQAPIQSWSWIVAPRSPKNIYLSIVAQQAFVMITSGAIQRLKPIVGHCQFAVGMLLGVPCIVTGSGFVLKDVQLIKVLWIWIWICLSVSGLRQGWR